MLLRRVIVLVMLLAGCAKSDPVEPGKAAASGKAAISPTYVPFVPPEGSSSADSADRSK